MGRPRKAGKRVGKRLSQAKGDIAARNAPADYVLLRRKLWSFITPTKGPDGRGGEIDQDVCDGIGQLHALGLLDGHGVDPQEMRDKGRIYAELYWKRYSATAPKMGSFERADKSTSTYDGETAADRMFERMDQAMTGYDRACVTDLVVDPAWGDSVTPWARSLICEALLERGIAPPFMQFPTMDDRARLAAAIRGLCAIVDGSLPQRWERAA